MTAAALGIGTCAADEPASSSDTELAPICTDRPTKGSYACTVDAHHFQYESDIVNLAYSSFSLDRVDTWMVPNPTLKYGVDSRLDVEANFAPWVSVETHGREPESHSSGIGDLLLRVKYRVVGQNDSVLSVSMVPYVKLPTARVGIGNGAVEEGVIAPVNFKISGSITLSASPEIDVLKDSAAGGRHLNTLQVVNVGVALNSKLIWYTELSADWNFDPLAIRRQCSADMALAYLRNNWLQIDVGWNVGLNRETPALQSYLGISQKF